MASYWPMSPTSWPHFLARFPWRAAARTLGARMGEDRLPLSAGSLTFTTTIALVPFFTVVLAVFTAFPAFSKLQGAVQAWLVQSLVPESIARQVLGYLTQFAGKASRLGSFSLLFLVLSALSLVVTIERTLNGIWRVRRPRSWSRRLLMYWGVMTLGPLLLMASFSISSYLLSASRGLVSSVPWVLRWGLDAFEFLLLSAGLAALYRHVPNTPVRRVHAWGGALFTALGIEIARRLLAWYLVAVPTYSAVYGAFATVPILLVWIYVVWLIVLMGATLAAHLPGLQAQQAQAVRGAGSHFQMALQVLRALDRARQTPERGLTQGDLAKALGVGGPRLEPALDVLVALDWVGRLDEEGRGTDEARLVLMADPADTPLAPLVRRLLLADTEATRKIWASESGLTAASLRDVL